VGARHAVLLAGELVTNAVIHGGGRFVLNVEFRSARLRVSVADGAPQVPVVLPTSAFQEHGRGMMLVDALATQWGTDVHDVGKTVWFELDPSIRPIPIAHNGSRRGRHTI